MTSSVLLTWGSGNFAVLLFSFVEGGEFVCCIPLRPLPRPLPRTVDGDDDGGESAPLGVFFFAIGIRYHEITKISSVWCCCPLNKILVDIISGCSKKKKEENGLGRTATLHYEIRTFYVCTLYEHFPYTW